MEDNKNYLYANDAEKLQITHDEYLALMEKAEEAKRLQQVKETVAADLQRILDGGTLAEPEASHEEHVEPETSHEGHVEPEASHEGQVEPETSHEGHVEPETSHEGNVEQETSHEEHNEPETSHEENAEPETSHEPEASHEENIDPEVSHEENAEPERSCEDHSETESESPEAEAGESESTDQQPTANARADISELPPIKNEIAEHFNKLDESGRLFSVFKQYYTCLNEACGGTVRVTMKDGFCSLWNYDEWEEFAFVDIFENLLRIAIDPRYTDALKSLSLCEAPRLISSRRNVICVQVDDLNNTVLDVLAKAFSEVGMQVS